MSSIVHSYPVRRSSIVGRFVMELAARHLARARRRIRIRQDRDRLRRLPDYLLRDLGISRAEIDAVTEHGRAHPDRLRSR